ncbi:MAG TPA: 2OG-Fe(II) oxygenase, partial [Blastocatellia bacterium]|nr:2OG-Fe(II) oxygenase [Blastocatellia bacterium]
ISCTLYLNDNWQAEAGGQLRLYLPEGSVDVLPEAGTCALFRSDIFFHEVLPATKTRFSLTGWFRRRSLKLL